MVGNLNVHCKTSCCIIFSYGEGRISWKMTRFWTVCATRTVDHQYISVIHRDCDNVHGHITVNIVNPKRCRVADNSFDAKYCKESSFVCNTAGIGRVISSSGCVFDEVFRLHPRVQMNFYYSPTVKPFMPARSTHFGRKMICWERMTASTGCSSITYSLRPTPFSDVKVKGRPIIHLMN